MLHCLTNNSGTTRQAACATMQGDFKLFLWRWFLCFSIAQCGIDPMQSLVGNIDTAGHRKNHPVIQNYRGPTFIHQLAQYRQDQIQIRSSFLFQPVLKFTRFCILCAPYLLNLGVKSIRQNTEILGRHCGTFFCYVFFFGGQIRFQPLEFFLQRFRVSRYFGNDPFPEQRVSKQALWIYCQNCLWRCRFRLGKNLRRPSQPC